MVRDDLIEKAATVRHLREVRESDVLLHIENKKCPQRDSLVVQWLRPHSRGVGFVPWTGS